MFTLFNGNETSDHETVDAAIEAARSRQLEAFHVEDEQGTQWYVEWPQPVWV